MWSIGEEDIYSPYSKLRGYIDER